MPRIEAVNNAVELMVHRKGDQVELKPKFRRREGWGLPATFDRAELKSIIQKMRNGDIRDFNGNLRRICQEGRELLLFFAPHDGCDLILVRKVDLLDVLG